MTKPDGYYHTILVKTHGDHDKALAAVRKTCSEVAEELKGMPLELTCYYITDIMDEALQPQRNTMSLVLTFMLVSIPELRSPTRSLSRLGHPSKLDGSHCSID